MDHNPYKPPVVVDGPIDIPGRPLISVHGKYLVVASGVTLPPRCVKSNAKVTEQDMRRKVFAWCSPWVALTILISLCVTVILYFVLRKSCEVTFGLHPAVRAKYRNRLIFKLLLTVGLLLAIPMLAAAESEAILGVAVLMFLVSFIALLIGNSPLSVAKYGDGRFWIKGCSQEFLDDLVGEKATLAKFPLF